MPPLWALGREDSNFPTNVVWGKLLRIAEDLGRDITAVSLKRCRHLGVHPKVVGGQRAFTLFL